jgi:CheY-like chemotaxis protein
LTGLEKKEVHEPMDKGMNSSGPEADKQGRRLLLVVDGAVSDSFYTSILLQRLEYNIYTAKTAEDALEIMGITVPSLVLAEVTLPRMSGIELLEHIKQDPRTAVIPVILHTSEKNPAYEERCRRAGCAGYLVKPVDPNTLYAAVQSATESTPRSVIRLKTRLGVIVEAETADEQAASEECITYLSENGLYIDTADPQPPGTVLPIIFSLRNITIRTEGIVLYSFTKRSRPFKQHGMGLKFLQISAEDKSLIRMFIMEQLTKNIASMGKGGPPL